MALMLLGNIATQSAVLQAVKACCGSPGSSELQSIVNLMVSRDASLVTKAATLLGNLSHNAALRQQVCRAYSMHYYTKYCNE